MDNLKVLYAGLGDSAVEVEHVALGVVVPNGRFVVQFQNAFHLFALVAFDDAVVVGIGLNKDSTF